MLNSLSIKNFKCLEDITINSLKPVNLFIGENNAGKSTLLEAIATYASGGDIIALQKILESRGLHFLTRNNAHYNAATEIQLISSIYTGYSTNDFFKHPIEISGNLSPKGNTKLSISLVAYKDAEYTDPAGNTFKTRAIIPIKSDEDITSADLYGLSCSLDNKSINYQFAPNYYYSAKDPFLPYEYVRTSQIIRETNPLLFDKIALTPLQDELINVLDIIEPNISGISFIKEEKPFSQNQIDNRVPTVVLRGNDKRYLLSSMGDGVNRILSIILALLNCKDGILLIDEFENGLHYSVQERLWKMIFKLATDLNVQVFATTHSNDCLKSFISTEGQDRGRIIRLESDNKKIIPVEFTDNDRLKFAINNNIEIR